MEKRAEVFSIESKSSVVEIRKLLGQAETAVRQGRRKRAIVLLIRAIATLLAQEGRSK